jgi:hypothetical protein
MNSYNFSISINTNPTSFNTRPGTEFVLSTAVMNLTEASRFSVWDLTWKNWFVGVSMGFWQFYCPDQCGESAVGWVNFNVHNILEVPQSWIAMNAVRWMPTNGGASADVNITGTLGGWTGQQTVRLSIDNMNPHPENYSLPYGSSPSPSSKALTSSGIKDITYPWGIFSRISPVRPLHGSINVNQDQTVEFGDLVIFPSQADTVAFNAWYAVEPTIRIPEGFQPVVFTGTKSKVGIIETVLEITTSSAIQIMTPLLHYNYTLGPSGRRDVGALVFNPNDGSSWYLAAHSYNADPLYPHRIGISLVSSALLVFGSLNNSVNTALPATFGKTLSYIGEWNSKTLSFGPVNATISGQSDLRIIVTQSAPLASNYEASASYFFGTTGANANTVITLSAVGINTTSWAYNLLT